MTSILVDKFMEKYVRFELFSLKCCTVLEKYKRTPQFRLFISKCEIRYLSFDHTPNFEEVQS